MNDAELRERLAVACRVLYVEGHDHFYLGHLSARSSSGDTIWVKPAGLGLEEIHADDLALMDMDGKLLEGKHRLHNEMPIHTEVYKRQPDVRAIVHTHPFYASALASSRTAFEMMSQDSILFFRGVGYYPSAELVMTQEQGQRLADALGDLRGALMRNHGITVVGSTIEDATVWAASLERSCRVQLVAGQYGALMPIEPDEVERMADRFEHGYAGRSQALWNYLVRKTQRMGLG